MNSMADIESRAHPDRSDWKLAPLIFQKIHQLLGPLSVDLFASRLSAQLPLYVSWKPDPLAMGTGAFSMNWTTLPGKIYANPPWDLIGRVLSTAQSQRVQEMVLVAPVWKAQAWYPLLLQMLVREPLIIPHSQETIQSECLNNLPDIIPQLAVWVISGVCVRSSNLSVSATDLVLSSWRDKSTKSYDSSFGRWTRWCDERDKNPSSGPISDIANFLAELYEKDYQYRSINDLPFCHLLSP